MIQIDGIHMDEDMTLVAAIGVDANGDKHPLGLVEGAAENAATVPAVRAFICPCYDVSAVYFSKLAGFPFWTG